MHNPALTKKLNAYKMPVIGQVVSSAAQASWVVMYTMNNYTYNGMESVLYLSCLGAKDTTQ